MKKFIILSITFGFLCTNCTFALNANQSTLGKIEDNLYGFQYSHENNTTRLNRIEETVYGVSSKKSETERIAKLKKDLASDLIGQEITPTEDTFANPQDSYKEPPPPKAASNVSYPAVDEMEEQTFNKTFPKEDISKRLANLEQKTFNKTYTDDLSTRVDRLKAKIKPQSLMNNQIAQSSNSFYDQEDVVPLSGDYHLKKYMQKDLFDYDSFNKRQNSMYENDYPSYTPREQKKASISTVEKKLLKQNYNQDTLENRLARIEEYMFGTVFDSDDNETRANRISSAYNAQKSSGKYDSNKFAQSMTTGVQIGMLILMVLACIL